MFKKLLSVVVCIVVTAPFSFAQINLYSDQLVSGPSAISAMGSAGDGGYIISGLFDRINGVRCKNVVKIDAHGNLDASFKQLTVDDKVFKIQRLPSGKILLAGWFHTINGKQASLLQLNSDGSIDASFQELVLGEEEVVSGFDIQSTGQIIVVGNFSRGNATGVLRLNSDGSIDNTFISGIAGDWFTRVLVDDANAIYLTNGKKLFKLSMNGGSVSGFPISTDGSINQIKQYADKVLIAGYFSSAKGHKRIDMAVFESNGTINDFVMNDNPSPVDVALKEDGKIVILASYYALELYDSTEYVNPLVPGLPGNINTPHALFMDSDEALLVAGKTSLYVDGDKTTSIVRFDKDYALDPTFQCEVTYSYGLSVLGTYPDGRFVAATLVTTPVMASWSKRLIRFNSDGTIDNSFDPAVTDDYIPSLAVQADGKILYCSGNTLLRLKETGASDASFGPVSTPFTNNTFSKVQIKDGSVFLGGFFTTVNSHASPGIVKLLADGTIDATFKSQLPEVSVVTGFYFQPDNKIIVTGSMHFPNSTIRSVVRLHADGSVDESFTKGNASNGVNGIAFDNQGRIYACGGFQDYNGSGKDKLVRLLPDGTVDETFAPALPFYSASKLSFVHVLPGNQILAGVDNLEDIGVNYIGYDNKGFVIYDSEGHIANSNLNSYAEAGTIKSVHIDGARLYLSGHFVSPDGDAVAAIAVLEQTMSGQEITFATLPEKIFGDSPFLLNASASSGLPVTFVSQDATIASITDNTVTIHKAGSVIIKAQQAGNDNFTAAAPIERSLLINKADQTLTFAEIADKNIQDLHDNNTFAISCTASSGLTPQVISADESIAVVTGLNVIIHNAGEVLLTATQAGNENYNPAQSVSRTLHIKLITGTELAAAQNSRVYPNPGRGLYTIPVLPSLSTGTYHIISSTGGLKRSQSYVATDGTLLLDMTDQPTGLYLVTIGNDKGSFTYKVIKE